LIQTLAFLISGNIREEPSIEWEEGKGKEGAKKESF
jgi:hypothetical protein